MSVDRREVARRHGLPATFAERLRGETAAELEVDAAALAALRQTPDAEPDAEPDYSGISASGQVLLDQLGLVATKQADGRLDFESARAKGLADLEAQRALSASRIRRRFGGR